MFKWLGKKIEKFTTIFHGGVSIEKELTASTDDKALNVIVNDNLTAHSTYVGSRIEHKKTGITGSGESSNMNSLSVVSTDAASNVSGAQVTQTALEVIVESSSVAGTITATGIGIAMQGTLSGSSITRGINSNVVNGGEDIRMNSFVNPLDYCSIATTTNGATTITTVDGDAALANFEIAADGNITLDSAGDIALECAGGDLTCDADTVTFESANADDPTVIIKNTTADNQGARLQMKKDRGAAMAANDRVGEIDFIGEDADQNTQQYAKVLVQADVVTHGQESGKMRFQVASHDGYLENALILTGGSEDGEVDATIGLGANSKVTIPGNIDLAGDIDVDGTLETAALTIGGVSQSGANTGDETLARINALDVTELGTVTSGVWNGTAIAASYTKHLSHYEFMGFNTNSSESTYQHSSPMTDTKAPFEHHVDHNADATTEMVVGTYLAAGGQVVPRSGTVTLITGWARAQLGATSPAPEHTIAIVKLTPVQNNSDPVAPAIIDEIEFTALGNNKAVDLRQTSISGASVSAGDILMTMMKDDTGGRTVYFNLTVQVES